MGQAAETAGELKVEIIGGHTEITPAVKQPVIVSTAIGKTPEGTSQSGDTMVEGDYIMMTKSVGLEGTGIIACDYEEQLIGRLTSEEIAEAKGFLNLVSVVPEGVAAGKVGTHGMHDITEGGILGAAWEMCQIAGKGAEVWYDSIPIRPEVKKVSEFFDINPLRLISSGSMVIIVPEDKKEEMEKAMEAVDVDCSIIGRIKQADFGIKLLKDGELSEIDPPYADEIYKVVGK